jgi:hypothetical protein
MAFNLHDLDRFDAERLKPPPVLYKYVAPDRVDVLERALIRFTPPLNTNDIFEVRQTFDLIWGPKMHAYFKEMSKDINFDDPVAKAFQELGLESLPDEQKAALVSSVLGPKPKQTLHALFGLFLDRLPALMNDPQQIDDLLERVAAKQRLLSLSERAASSPMWAHYADNSKGFVIAFDTESRFFQRGEQNDRQGLHKVRYFDDRVGEIMDDPFAALVSKQADWSYEREWRLYAKADDVAQVIKGGEEDIHLVGFPRGAIARVILGLRVSPELERELRRVLESDYPGVALMRLKAERSTAKLTEEPA